ncbi:unnamed protein product [Danaus chrysippus]|uniref:(African queen) hypothetical protein n=1 Tax=Danaus chrysippus TaxID=151541 RepID=A0A8J2QXF7_9NEOP|nr:unnamed protein product [Danaus chrysippus]
MVDPSVAGFVNKLMEFTSRSYSEAKVLPSLFAPKQTNEYGMSFERPKLKSAADPAHMYVVSGCDVVDQRLRVSDV